MYKRLLLTKRQRLSNVSDRTIVTESESDRGRVLFCAAFRRLQQKAQVFSMEPNAAVRSRLTHSLEVSQIGRYIADEICAALAEKSLLEAADGAALVNFVETACLMHDIGNPPFGHFGEAAIQSWFRDKGSDCMLDAISLKRGKLEKDDPCLEEFLVDFFEFDGNPQGLRIVSRLQWNTDPYGLNLTSTTIAAYLKYIRQAGDSSEGQFRKKAGYFSTEKDIVENVWRDFDYTQPQRFPLAYIMEAADDIAYCISDLEDSFEKSIVDQQFALGEIERSFLRHKFAEDDASYAAIKEAIEFIRIGRRDDGTEYTYTDFRTSLNRTLVKFAAARYVLNHDNALNGSLDSLLPNETACGAILDVLKNFCRSFVYTDEGIQLTELAGYTAIRGLLDHCSPLLKCSAERFQAVIAFAKNDNLQKPIIIETKILRLFPEKSLKVYKSSIQTLDITSDDGRLKEWNSRAHLVVDYISGMTDDFAMSTYRTLAGMRL